jgi:hypothetical protein
MIDRRTFVIRGAAFAFTPLLPRETFADVLETGQEPQAAGPFLDGVEGYFQQRLTTYRKFGPFRIHPKHREEAYHYLSWAYYKITMVHELIPHFRVMPFDARQTHMLLIHETIKHHHQRAERFGAVGQLWRTHHLQEMLAAFNTISRGETPARITAKGFRKLDIQIAKEINDRVPPSPDALNWNSEGHIITGGPSSDEKYRRFREAADKLHREVEEMKRLEAEGKLQKPYRGLVSPDGKTCRPKKRLNIPPVLS